MMIRRPLMPALLLTLLAAAIPASVHAQKLYKIVDEEGNVSFSQFPPMEKAETETVEDIVVNSRSQSTITVAVDGRYCGKIRLLDEPTAKTSTASYVKRLEKNRDSWRDQLDNLSRRVDQNNQNTIKRNQDRSQSRYGDAYQASQSKQYEASVAANTERLRDLRCAVDWADSEYLGALDLVANSSAERARLEAINDKLQANLEKRCGDLPAYDPSIAGNGVDRKNWYTCSADLRREIKLVKQKIGNL